MVARTVFKVMAADEVSEFTATSKRLRRIQIVPTIRLKDALLIDAGDDAVLIEPGFVPAAVKVSIGREVIDVSPATAGLFEPSLLLENRIPKLVGIHFEQTSPFNGLASYSLLCGIDFQLEIKGLFLLRRGDLK